VDVTVTVTMPGDEVGAVGPCVDLKLRLPLDMSEMWGVMTDSDSDSGSDAASWRQPKT
jgi:hypothetical protein